MLKIGVLLFLVCATCYGDIPVPPPQQPRVLCGETPNQLFACLGNPNIFNATQTCQRSSDPTSTQCSKMTCIFRTSGWFNGPNVIKSKVSDHLDSYMAAHPEWAPAVQHAKTNCLQADLPAQGYFMDCPAYDIVMCTLASFIKNAQPSQWSSSSKCDYSKQYAASCPVCPQECFAPAIPMGSCNACYALPRTP